MERETQATRRRASVVLAALGASLLLFGGVLLYAGHEIFDSKDFARNAASTLDDERVREPLAEAIVDGLIAKAEPDLVNARPVLVSVTSGLVGTPAFRAVFRTAAERAHRTVFTREGDELVLNLADGAALAVGALKALSPELAEQVPPDATTRLNELVESELALGLAKSAEDIRFAGVALPLIALLMLVGAVVLDRDRRRGLLTISVSVAVAAGVGFAALLAARALVLARLEADFRDPAAAAWDAFLGGLGTAFLIALGAALIAAAAISTRRRAEARDPLRRIAAFAERTGATPLSRALRALTALAVGILVVLSPETFVRLLAVTVGAYAIFFGLSELLLLIAPPPEAEAEREPLRSRLRPLPIVAAVAALAAVVVVLVSGGEERRAKARAAASIERCNGFAELCDKRVNEVVFPSVHNAMSAANDDFLIANNQRPIPDQLEAGVRGLLIDAHYGREGKDGQIVTDLAREGQTRAKIEKQVGAEFVDTAERLIGRIAGADPKGESKPYFCHVFCELGATPLAEELVRVREFLDTHPDEVVVLFIEDYVTPAEIEKGFVESELVDYAYVQKPGLPLPTLREMIASGKRLLVMAENEGGGETIPWYIQGFDYTQETPFTFNSVTELEGKTSCEPNRGSDDNPLFQLNHWVEKMPRSPKTAAQVNAYSFLFDRARRCRRERGLLPNLIGVDFWEQGDLFEVARRLNGLGRDAEPEYSETG